MEENVKLSLELLRFIDVDAVKDIQALIVKLHKTHVVLPFV